MASGSNETQGKVLPHHQGTFRDSLPLFLTACYGRYPAPEAYGRSRNNGY